MAIDRVITGNVVVGGDSRTGKDLTGPDVVPPDPLPDGDMVLTFSDIVQCGADNCIGGSSFLADNLNGTWGLWQTANPNIYSCSDVDPDLSFRVTFSGDQIEIHVVLMTELPVFYYSGPINTNKTYANSVTACTTACRETGKDGTCYINKMPV